MFVGHFVTLDVLLPEVEALAVANGRIVAAGTRAEMLALAGEKVQRIEVPGIAVPGWVDAHVHISGLGSTLETLNVERMSKEEIAKAVAVVTQKTPAGDWIIGRGWDEGYFAKRADPTAADLDPVTAQHPVVLSGIGEHSVWVNSLALERAGINNETPDPPGGRIVRDAEGHATGLLLEEAQKLVSAVMPDTNTPEARERRIRAALQQYVRWGLTGVHDAGTDLADIAILKRLAASGELPIRVYAMAYGDAAIEHYLKNGPELGLGDGHLTVRSFKIYVDGALGSRGAELSAPYADAPQTSGLPQMQDADIDRFIRRAQQKHFQVNAHAIGDLAVKRMLDAIERNHVSATDRYRIEHASMIAPRDVQRFHELGVIASMQPVFIGEYSRWGVERVGPQRAPWLMPVADLVIARAMIASGTDYPASDSGDPRATLNALVTRTGFDGKPKEGFYPLQAVGMSTALWSMSEAPAHAAFQENDLGKLTIGRYADFTVLGEDPRKVSKERLLQIPVLMTVVGGKVLKREGGS
ncbi:MAG TPA: amidohydrolase [Steroidobacteraceae bacterium]|nr:amidohydrolase [Steroidobacteraceae bacterium]